MDALRASAHNEKVHWGGEQAETEDRTAFLKRLSEHSEVPVNEALFSSVTMEEWKALFKLSASHKVLPLVYNVAYDCPVFIEASRDETVGPFIKNISRAAIREIMLQTLKTDSFRKLYEFLEERNVHPIVVKGLVLRNLYPNGDQRPSTDEDILIPALEWKTAIAALQEFGMEPMGKWDETDFEIGWQKEALYVELHQSLFSPDSEYGKIFAPYFEDAPNRAVSVTVVTGGINSAMANEGFTVNTFAPEDHLLYLLTHAWKHFVHSGFGIRQVMDIGLFGAFYGSEINWDALRKKCEELNIVRFAEAIFGIARNYLGITALRITEFARSTDEYPMLKDMLIGGLYGTSSKSRLHSSTITLNKVEAARNNKKSTFLKSAFPPAEKLRDAYPELEKHPVLLPVVWVKRIIRYRKETRNENNDKTTETLRIASERTKLLKLYGIIK